MVHIPENFKKNDLFNDEIISFKLIQHEFNHYRNNLIQL